MKLNEARFCPDCNEVFINKYHGQLITACPACTNKITVTLLSLVDMILSGKIKSVAMLKVGDKNA